MINALVTQVIGAIGYITIALSYFKKKKKDILFMEIIAYIFFTLHYYLLNGLAGAICNFIGLLALITIYLLDKHKTNYKLLVSMVFIIMLLVINLILFQNLFSIFPMIASTIVIISFLSDNENDIRIIGVIAAVCWLIYAIVYRSYIAIIFEILTFINVCIALLKNIGNKRA